MEVPDTEYFRGPTAYPSFAPNLWPERPPKYPPVSSSEHRLRKYLAGLRAEAAER